MKYIFLLLSIVISQLSLSSPDAGETQRQLDKTCQIFSQAMAVDLAAVERTRFIERELKSAEVNGGIIQAFDAIFLVAPEDRASVFKTSMSELIKGEWKCSAADKLFSAN